MTVVWIVTTGNSDIKLTSNTEWHYLKDLKREMLEPCYADFCPLEGSDDLFTLPARVMGIVYGDALETHWQYLTFPLLSEFIKKLESYRPDRIIVLLTDQEAIFDISDRGDRDCPYWKDTCTLEPIFERYFRDKYGVKIESVLLQPEKGQIGLDDWNATLTLVQKKFASLGIDENDEVIVSHQAGTPAISSAVQFASLSRFGDRVRFLTSNERTGVASIDPSSSYFESMQIQEAQKLLRNYNYVGVEEVLGKMLKEDNRDIAKNILALLEVAKLWNVSKFDDPESKDNFKSKIEELTPEQIPILDRSRFSGSPDSWAWWIAYEEAYLGIIRQKQGNIVEAFFHSFRAFEGIFAAWGNKIFKKNENENIVIQKDIPCLTKNVLEGDCQKYLAGSDLKSLREDLSKDGVLPLELMTLCKIFKKNRSDYKPTKCPDIVIFWDNDNEKRISARRNFIFHQIQGITEEQLLKFWLVNSASEWQDKILRFLNFIADEKDFKTWEEASLMAQVHEELVKEIEAIA